MRTRAAALAALIALGVTAAPAFPAPPFFGRHRRESPSKGSTAAGLTTVPSILPLGQVWQVDLDHDFAAPPGFDDLQAYVPETDGHLVAYVLVNGHQRWAIDLPTDTTPAAGGGLVYVATRDAVVAVAADDGHEVWRQPVGGPMAQPLTFDTGWLIGGTRGGEIWAWRARDGHLLWHVSVGAPLSAPATLGGDRLYVPLANGELLSLGLQTGRRVWTDRLGGPPTQVLPLDSRLFVGSTDKYFYALKTGDGTQDWRWRTGADIVGAAVVDEKRVYFVSLDNLLRALDRHSGTLQWQAPLPVRPSSGPQLAGDQAIVTGVYPPVMPVFQLTDGKRTGTLQLSGELVGPPHVMPWGFTLGPTLIVSTRSLGQPARLLALARALDPALRPLTALPGKTLTGY
ncbi:MAG: PQQ-binding-like beta-propeller repeat protein [Acidobacteriota bacterium]|nr:PQQ-binding-like beta-propeller repeat protein [Acidobacteriota bacterium]